MSGPRLDDAPAPAAARRRWAVELQRAEAEAAQRAKALRDVREAVWRLSDMGSRRSILKRAATALGQSSRFERVLLSEVRGDRLIPAEPWHGTRSGAAPIGERPADVHLVYPLVEAELVRTRDATRVAVAAAGGRAAPGLSAWLGWESYVVAPLVIDQTVVGLIHADPADASNPVSPLDVDVVATYATGLASAVERAALRELLQRHREAVRAALDAMDERVARATTPDQLAHERRGEGVADAALERLTTREREVLGLLARGLTNQTIGDVLAISEATVKYHVKNVLRKLNATSRADAVARLLGGGSRSGSGS